MSMFMAGMVFPGHPRCMSLKKHASDKNDDIDGGGGEPGTCAWGQQRTSYRSLFSPSTLWILSFELNSLGLSRSTL